MSEPIEETLETCLEAIAGGQNLERCLALYPGQAAQLLPVLEAAQAMRSLADSPLPAAAYQRSRARLLSRAAWLRANPAPSRAGYRPQVRWLRMALVALALAAAFWLSWQGLAVTSAKSLPGDPLYPVKRAVEGMALQLAPNREIRHRIEAQYDRLRIDEVKELLALGRVERITFEGVLAEMEGQTWIVEGIAVHLNPTTQIIGEIQTGRFVEVEGLTNPPGMISAHEIHLRFFQLSGTVEAIARQNWTIAGIQLGLRSDTQIDPVIQVGDQALALVYSEDNGNLTARAILRLPTPSPTFVPFEIEFTGRLENIDATQVWVNGKALALTPATQVEGQLAVGEMVSVRALVKADGSLTALHIKWLPNQPSGDSDQPGSTAVTEAQPEPTGGTAPQGQRAGHHDSGDSEAESSSKESAESDQDRGGGTEEGKDKDGNEESGDDDGHHDEGDEGKDHKSGDRGGDEGGDKDHGGKDEDRHEDNDQSSG
jgi:hypothetical protein